MPLPNSKVILVPTHTNAPSAGTSAKPKPPAFEDVLRKLGERMKKQMGARLHQADSVFDPSRLMDDITNQIIRDRRAMVLAFMGIETSFGDLRLSSNERKLNQEIKGRTEAATQQWIDENPDFFNGEISKVLNDPRLQKRLRSRFADSLSYRVERAVEEAASRVATDMAKDLENEVRGHLSLRGPEE